ncbi:MAG: PspC domain-containing protein [Candidatus Woesearchaeota archaeon]
MINGLFNLGNINVIGFSFFLVMGLLFGVFSLVAIVWAIVDCLNSNKETTEKLIWILVILFLNLIGVLLYVIFKDSEFEKEVSESVKKEDRVLARSESNKIFFGVCGGLGEYFNIDPTLIRLVLVLLFFLRGSGLLIYIIAAIVMPSESSLKNGEDDNESKGTKESRKDDKVKSTKSSDKSKKDNDKSKKSDEKKSQKKSNVLLFVILFFIFLLVISSFAIFIGLFSYSTTTDEDSSNFVREVQVVNERYDNKIHENNLNRSKKIAIEFIREYYVYRSNDGHNLTYLGIKEYDIGCSSESCYQFYYTFDSNEGIYEANIYVDNLKVVETNFELI